jgi:RNA polymerase sigma factor (sigma-70 family)
VLQTLEPGVAVLADMNRFDELFYRHFDELVRLARRITGDDLFADDVAQETFLKLNDSTILARPDSEVAAWLRRVCLNSSLNQLRSRKRQQAHAEELGQVTRLQENAAPGLETVAVNHETQLEIREILERLPEAQRDCLILRYSGYSYAEIAETLGLAIGSIGVYLARGERAFRSLYEGAVS